MTFARTVPSSFMMPKLHVIAGGAAPKARKRPRQSARDWPACPNCGGRERVQAKIGNVKNDLCVPCLMQGRRVVVE